MNTIFTPMKRATILGCAVLLASCGGGDGSPPPPISISPPPPISITFDGGTSGSIAQGQSIALKVTVANDTSGHGVSWALDGVGALSHQTGTAVEYDAPVTLSSAVTATVTASAVSDPSKSAAYTIAVTSLPAAFTETGSMSVARWAHAATLLLDGRVLVTGGNQSGLGLTSAELYDPLTGLFMATGNMTVAHYGHTGTLLANATLPNYGEVLIAGGDSGGTAAELYDPAVGTFAATGSMAVAHVHGPTATLLKTGKVLLAGGDTSAAELYDPPTGTFLATGNMTAVRSGHAATLLLDGRLLVTGGGVGVSGSATAELYEPGTGTFTATGSMATSRKGHTATRLQDGTVLVVGMPEASPEIYDPGTGTFTALPYPSGYWFGHTASLRADGTVLIAGGTYLTQGYCGSWPRSWTAAVLFAPGARGFTAIGGLITARDGHTATTLADGTVLVVGGTTKYLLNRGFCQIALQATALSSAELFH